MSCKETDFEIEPDTEQVGKRRKVDHDNSYSIENPSVDNDQQSMCGDDLKADIVDVDTAIVPCASESDEIICGSLAIVDTSCNTTETNMECISEVVEKYDHDQVDSDVVPREIDSISGCQSSCIVFEQMPECPSIQDFQNELSDQKQSNVMKNESDALPEFVETNEDDKINIKIENAQSSMGVDITSSRRKLLVLDVNGLLADVVTVSVVPDDYKADMIIGMKAVFKRPHCDDFLRFCFERFNVGIWSSRTKRNVDSVLELLLGENKSKLVFCWDQSHCTLTGHNTLENQKKPLVLKELKKLWEKDEPNLPWNIGDYNESNTLLLDDSPYKSLKNPPNTAIFPDTYQYKNLKDDSLGPEGDLRSYLERLYLAPNIQKYVEQNPYGQRPITETNPRWSFYANIIRLNSVKREESSCHSDVRHASRENITDIEWSKKTVKEESVTEDIHSTQNFDEQSQQDKLQIDKNEKNSSWDKWDRVTVDRNLVITACSSIQPSENSRNIREGENAISDIHGYDPPTQPNEQNRQSRTEDLIHLLSNKDHRQDCSAGCDTVVTTREPSRLPWIPRSSLGRNREVFRKTKLLILDVNGLLADFVTKEPDGYIADSRLGDKAVFKRPYCDDFLNFCFENFHIGFWLTTSKKLAQSNLNFLLGRAAKNVLFSWDISNCSETGYSTVERRDRQIIFKELRRLWEKDEQYLSCGRGEFDQSNTLLVDNYPCTALLNPPHTAIFPRRYRYKDEITDDSLGPEGDLRVFLEGLALAESVQDYVKNKPFGQRPISEKNLSWNYYVRVVEDTKARQKPWSENWWTPTNDHKNERNEQNSSWDKRDKLTVDRNLVLTACSSIKPCKTKLLILDVNGLLADFVSCEPDGYIADSKLGNTAVFKRPYCDDFLNFCFEKFHIGFWLTTSSKNARSNLDFLLGRAAKDVLFAWDISQCFDTGFNTVERRNRHILFKELRIVWEKNEWSSPWGREVFDQSNTLLVDNYPYTALLNPPHTGIFPPRYRYKDEITDDSLGPGGDLREFLEGLVLAENVQDYVKNNPFGQPPISDEHPSWNYYVRVIEDSKARQKPWLEKWWTPTNDHKKTC